MRISPRTDRKIKSSIKMTNCRSQNEFVEEALNFYCEYLAAKDCSQILPPILVSSFQGTIQDSENRIARLLFKLAVEINMMMHVLAAGLEINAEELDRLRGRCVQEVKRTSGSIALKDAVNYQKGAE